MRVLIAGGGTGGHIFPAVALGEAFRAEEPEAAILFVGTDNPLEISTLSGRGLDHVSIPAEALRGLGMRRQIHALLKIPKAIHAAMGIIQHFRPDIVLGVGGYASGPVALAAKLMRKKLAIHEQNLTPGFTNRIVGRFAHRIFVAFPRKMEMFKASKTIVTGNPVRQELLSVRRDEKRNGVFTLLVVGGSQGAHAINRAVVEALGYLKEPARMEFIHQTGPRDVSWVSAAYQRQGITATVESFFHDMARMYAAAQLVICRAGATTIAELTALGKPAIFIPFPFAAGHHQEQNASYVANSGGGEVILEKDLNGELLARRIDACFSNPYALETMSARASTLGRPHAAELIVKECRTLVAMHGGSH